MTRDVALLSPLVAQLRSASAAYRRAGADGPGLSDALGAAADSHDRTADALSVLLRALADPPAAEPDPTRHAWAGLPGAVARGPAATVQAVEAAEGELMAACQAALDDPGVSGPVRDALAQALDAVKAGRDRALRRLDSLGG